MIILVTFASTLPITNYLAQLLMTNTIATKPWKRSYGPSVGTFVCTLLHNNTVRLSRFADLHVLSSDVIVTISQWPQVWCGTLPSGSLVSFAVSFTQHDITDTDTERFIYFGLLHCRMIAFLIMLYVKDHQITNRIRIRTQDTLLTVEKAINGRNNAISVYTRS